MPSQPSISVATHAVHDLESWWPRSPRATPPGRSSRTATALVTGCQDCAALHAEIRAIAAAMPDLPAPVRTRDFRITPEQAASLRPTGWRALVGAIASPRFSLRRDRWARGWPRWASLAWWLGRHPGAMACPVGGDGRRVPRATTGPADERPGRAPEALARRRRRRRLQPWAPRPHPRPFSLNGARRGRSPRERSARAVRPLRRRRSHAKLGRGSGRHPLLLVRRGAWLVAASARFLGL